MESFGLEKVSRLLGTDQTTLEKVDNFLSLKTGRKGIFDLLGLALEKSINSALFSLNVDSDSFSSVKNSLLEKVEEGNRLLSASLNHPDLNFLKGRETVVKFIENVRGLPSGFFLKEKKAKELLISSPPEKVLQFLGYKTIEEAIAKENLFEIFASLRFIESSDWLNKVFFKKYLSLSPSDFEKRKVKIICLDEKWKNSAVDFVKHKRHNLTHLKELGAVFILPLSSNLEGELLRTVGLLFHYLEEVPFYSGVIENLASSKDCFAENLSSLLRGDVLVNPPEEDHSWLVVQRYLEKDDPHDWRLSFPHLNTESLLYSRAYSKFPKIKSFSPEAGHSLSFWSELDWVGGFFDHNGEESLLSFDLLDNSMSLVSGNDKIFSYHSHEALWNKIFSLFFNFAALEKSAEKNILSGFFLP